MNRSFKTVWSDLRQQYVTTSEKSMSRGKATKSAVALALACVVLGGGVIYR